MTASFCRTVPKLFAPTFHVPNILMVAFTSLYLSIQPNVQTAAASVIGPVVCELTAEVVAVNNQEALPSTSSTADLRVTSIREASFGPCPASVGKVYRVNTPTSQSFTIGLKLKAGISPVSAMSPTGVVSFLHWSGITNENGSPIRSNGQVIDTLQSDNAPLR